MAFQQSIVNPCVPFSGPIFGGLREGKMVLIQGTVQTFVKSFAVNLQCGNGDIAFHFNPRFQAAHPVIVCNTQQSSTGWGVEERTFHVPFKPGIRFEIIIHVKGHCYHVSVNGQPILEYRHRLPLHTVQTLEIKGDVSVNCINFTGSSNAPFSGPIFGGLCEGKMVLIQGTVQTLAQSFAVNLQCGNGDIAFHFNPRFHEAHPVIVCNTQQSSTGWGVEERTFHVPFKPGIRFEIIIHVKGHCYQVSVNGQHILEYGHRLPLHTVQTLEIKGDVIVTSVNFSSN